MQSFLNRILKSDEEKEAARKKRLQNPHHVKSKRHWDWDTGYGDIDIEATSNEELVNPDRSQKREV